MRERSNLILADFIAAKADEKPEHLVVTFEGAGVRDDETRTYVTKRKKEGLSTPEIMRCLKRYVARQTFKQLPHMT